MADDITDRPADPRILVVEDDAIIASGLVSVLQDGGATVTWCTNVSDALMAIERLGGLDVAIVDYNLDGVLSLSVLDELISQGIFTVLCTGYDASSIDERFWTLPRLVKPFTRKALRALLSQRRMEP